MNGLEPDHPDRITSSILGMGDVLTLIKKMQELEFGGRSQISGRAGV